MRPQNRHLIPWKPGQSGNPKGRPKGRRMTSILRELLDSEEIGSVAAPDGKTIADLFVEAVLAHTMQTGNPALIKEIFDRIDGKVPKAASTEAEDQHAPRIHVPDTDPRFESGVEGGPALPDEASV